jgi:hypothetical protein
MPADYNTNANIGIRRECVSRDPNEGRVTIAEMRNFEPYQIYVVLCAEYELNGRYYVRGEQLGMDWVDVHPITGALTVRYSDAACVQLARDFAASMIGPFN